MISDTIRGTMSEVIAPKASAAAVPLLAGFLVAAFIYAAHRSLRGVWLGRELGRARQDASPADQSEKARGQEREPGGEYWSRILGLS